MSKSPPPFNFILNELFSVDTRVRPMFGCQAIYVKDKLVLMLRQKESHRHDNGIWVATSHQHHESLRKEFPSMRSIKLFGGKESAWQNLPEDALDFEECALKACALILKNDFRIGKIPKPRKKK